jgi:hypothetical protein
VIAAIMALRVPARITAIILEALDPIAGTAVARVLREDGRGSRRALGPRVAARLAPRPPLPLRDSCVRENP